jgi:hypothetical protein
VAIAFLSLFISSAQAQAPLSVTPKTVKAGTTPALTLASNGFFDFSRVTLAQLSISPRDGISGIRVSNATPQSVILSFDLASNATGGTRFLSIDANDVTVTVKFAVEPVAQACNPRSCRSPNRCVNGVCTAPACTPTNCRRPSRCVDDVCVTPPPPRVCVPACTGPTRCINGECKILD